MKNRIYSAVITLLIAIFYSVPSFAQVAQAIPPAEQCFQATTSINGMIGTLGTVTGGSGGTAGTYVNVPLTGGSGTTATANITVTGGAVTGVVISNPGLNYAVSDSLSAASGNIGGVTGFSVPVASISINSSLAGGFVGMYIPGTLTPSNTWQDAAQSTLNANPVALDANGCAIMYGIGTYRQVVYDSLGNVVWDKNTSVSPIVLFAGTSTGTPNVQAVTAAAFTSGNGQQIIYKANLANTGPMTLSVNGGGAIAVNKDNPTVTALTGGEISAGSIVTVTYDSVAGYFHLANINNTILASGNTPFTGNNTHAGTETFNGPAIFNSTTTLTGATTIANNTSATFNGPVNYNEQTLTVTANATTWNMALGPDAYVTNSTNLTFNAPTNVPANGRGYLRINNTASGPIQLTWNAAFAAFTNGSPLPTYIPPGITYLQYDVNSGTVNINYSPAQPGGWIELNKITISNQATVSDTTSFLLGFAEYEITFQNVVPVTNSVGFKFQPYVSGAFQSSITKQSVLSNTGSTGGNQTTNGGFTNGTVLNTAGNGVTARFSILNPAYTSGVKYIHFTSSEIVSSGGPQEFETGMMYYSGSNAAVTGFQLLATSGNLSTGTVIVRGRN